MIITALIFTKLSPHRQLCAKKNFYMEFHKNPTNSTVSGTRTRTRTDGLGVHKGVLLYCLEFVKNASR
jgi:hypothetical protein